MQSYTDYLMVIMPPQSIVHEIERYKRASVNTIGHFEGMHSRGYITITHQTRCKPFLAGPAILKIEQRLCTMPPIVLQLNGFSYFINASKTKTIYAQIASTTQTDNWFKLLTRQLGIKIKIPGPHIPIASNIPATAFNKLWPHFKNRTWNETFTVNSLTILHRETYVEYCEWQHYKELFFENRLKGAF